jgi:hypothetical protein
VPTKCLSASTLALFAAATASSFCRLAPADIVHLSPAADTTILRNNGAPASRTSNALGDGIYVGRTYLFSDNTQRGLIRFDLSTIPPGATISSVTLSLQMINVSPAAFETPISLHRISASWGTGASMSFGGGGAQSEANDANWYDRFFPGTGGNTWTTPGGDYAATPSATTAMPITPGIQVSWSSAAMAADVAGWLGSPSTNLGWVLIGNEPTRGSSRKFGSSEHPDPASKPVLTVEYSSGCDAAGVTTDPQDAYSCLRGNAGFSVVASGTAPITYSWQLEDPDAPGTWLTLSNGLLIRNNTTVATVSGASTSSLSLSTIRHESNASGVYSLRALVSNACTQAPVPSAPASLRICAADFNCDGQSDFFDYLDFVQAFDAEHPAADYNGDDTIDFFDYLDFAVALDQGCE